MMCSVCGLENPVTCLCGFCPDCIEQYGHEECTRMAQRRETREEEE